MTEFEPFSATNHEGNLYRRIGALEAELAAAEQHNHELERQLYIWQDRTKTMLKLAIVLLVALIIAAMFIAVVSTYLIFR
jgi:hypothetical protein